MCQQTDTWALLGGGRMGRTRESAEKREDLRDGGSLSGAGVAVVCVCAHTPMQVHRTIQLSPK